MKQRILQVLTAILAVGALSVPALDFHSTITQTQSWQAREIEDWEKAAYAYSDDQTDVEPPDLAAWVTQNAGTVALGVWTQAKANLTSSAAGLGLLFQLVGGILKKRKRDEMIDELINRAYTDIEKAIKSMRNPELGRIPRFTMTKKRRHS